MRVAIGGIMHESNTFSLGPRPLSVQLFKNSYLFLEQIVYRTGSPVSCLQMGLGLV